MGLLRGDSMKLKKGEIVLVGIIVCLFAFIFIVNVYPSFDIQEDKKTMLYFNADTDLPDTMLYLKGKTINEIYVGQTYYLNFTITSVETYPIIYTYVVESTIVDTINEITLEPGENRSICIEVTPKESDKWELDYNTTCTWEHVIDLTNDSKIVEWRKWGIEDNMSGPETKVIGSFGGLFSSNISIDELRKKSLINEHITEYNDGYEKTRTINLINISVIDDKLYLKVISKDMIYTSENQLCCIKIFVPQQSKDGEINREKQIKLEKEKEIRFYYFIKMDKK